MIRAIIVDDEPLARERIRTLLADEPDIEVVSEAEDGRSAISAIQDDEPDLVFLDVNMPEFDGFDVLEAIDVTSTPVVVFVTAYDEHAVRAFEANALDYLLKPFDESRFRTALSRAKDALTRRDNGSIQEQLDALLGEVRKPRYLERIAIRDNGRILMVRTRDIEWIGAEGNYARINGGGKSHLIRETMTALESKLDPRRFLRIHRSTIVNTDAIAELEPLYQGDHVIILRDGTRLTSSRGYRAKLQAFMGA